MKKVEDPEIGENNLDAVLCYLYSSNNFKSLSVKFSVAIKRREANYTCHCCATMASVFYTRVSLMAMGQFGNRVAEFSPSMMER